MSTRDTLALSRYETALGQFQSYFGNPIATIDAALRQAPDFMLGHVFKGTVYLLLADRRFVPAARRSLAAAATLSSRASARERGLLHAARRWSAGDWLGACRAYEEVLIAHPRDAFALQAAHLTDFYRADQKNLRDRVARVLPHWSRELPGYPYVLGMYAFGLAECNQLCEAEDIAQRALLLAPKNPWALHAIAHVLESQARFDEGIALFTSRVADWASGNSLAFHNWWHLALYHLERNDHEQALRIYDAQILPQRPELTLRLADASALLWRLHLQDIELSRRWRHLGAQWQRQERAEHRHCTFNDVHAMMAYVGAGCDAQAAALMRDLEVAAGRAELDAVTIREVVLPVCAALDAFGKGHYDRAAELLFPVRAVAHRLGAGQLQSEVLDQTLIEAAVRAGRTRLAEHLINERTYQKPHSPLAWSLMAKAHRAAGATGDAEQAAEMANALVA